MRLPFQRGLPPRSPLAYLSSIPGTVALYDPGRQIATGTTGQVLTDFSGHGNHAQLGSTAGADANDPSWGTNALTFGGDDYCTVPNLGVKDRTIFIVFKDDVEETPSAMGLFSMNNIRIERHSALKVRSGIMSTSGAYAIDSEAYSNAGLWRLVTVRIASGNPTLGACSVSGVGSLASTGRILDEEYTTYSRTLGKMPPELYLSGSVASLVYFNRVLGDGEASRVRANIVSLMNGQGVSLA